MDLRYTRLTLNQRNRLLEHFVAGATARMAAQVIGINRNTARLFFHRLREIVAEEQEKCSPLSGEIEVDESYLGGRRKGKRGRGARGKVPVFGLLKRGGKVYTKIIANAKADTLLPIMQTMIVPDSVSYSDSLPSYNVLDVSEFKHFRINHSQRFVDRHTHINGIENLWNQAKRYLRKFNGIPRQSFYLFLKECECRFNNPSPKTQLQQLKTWIKLRQPH